MCLENQVTFQVAPLVTAANFPQVPGDARSAEKRQPQVHVFYRIGNVVLVCLSPFMVAGFLEARPIVMLHIVDVLV
jgi:hypothetical protein